MPGSKEQDASPSPQADSGSASIVVVDLTQDLQRLAADFANYRRRSEAAISSARADATAQILTKFIPLLDNAERALSHGDLDVGYNSMIQQLQGVAHSLGLTPFAKSGELFDPHLHDAITHQGDPSLQSQVITQVFLTGYSLGPKVLRHAQVAVSAA